MIEFTQLEDNLLLDLSSPCSLLKDIQENPLLPPTEKTIKGLIETLISVLVWYKIWDNIERDLRLTKLGRPK